MLIVPKKDSLEGKLSTVCYARLIFSCGEIIIENIHSWVSKLLPLEEKKKFYFVLFDRSPPDSSKIQEVSYGHTCPILQGVSPSLSIYGFTLLFIHLPAYLHQKNKRRKLMYHIFYLTTAHHIHISAIRLSS